MTTWMFYLGVVTTHDGWPSPEHEFVGAIVYNPEDVPKYHWVRIMNTSTNEWKTIEKHEVPKEFLMQLLLLGVPT